MSLTYYVNSQEPENFSVLVCMLFKCHKFELYLNEIEAMVNNSSGAQPRRGAFATTILSNAKHDLAHELRAQSGSLTMEHENGWKYP